MKRRFLACNLAHNNLAKENSATNEDSDAIDPCPCKGKPIAEGCLACGFPFVW